MSQHNLRRSLAAFAFATLATLSPWTDLHASPLRHGRPEGRDEARGERRESFPMWKPLLHLFEKIGVRIDDNGLRFSTSAPEDSTEKIGARIDDNG